MQKQIIECVPNFSEGNNLEILNQIKEAISQTEGVKFLDMDPGKATNRTVMTFVGEPEVVIEAAFRGIKKASELIDMSKHKGEHPRMGATDVCPLIPINGISMEETVKYAQKLGKRVGEELKIPVYLYESAAQKLERKNLATIRAGEYEGFSEKIKDSNWLPDFGPAVFNSKSGCTAIGARDFLLAYNVNLNTTSTRRANAVAFDLRENGRVKEVDGKKVLDENGVEVREPGLLKSVKAIGWYIEEYGIAQISMNLTNISITPLHIAFDAAVERAHARGMRVTGSELVGLVPLKSMLDAGKYFLEKQRRSKGVSEEELIRIAVKSMGLDELAPFDPQKKIIEYVMNDNQPKKLINLSLKDFANETSAESPAPGGGSVSAAVAALGTSLGVMVANLSSHKKGWDNQIAYFSEWAEKGQAIKDDLLRLVDEDTHSFNRIMEAFALPKSTDEEKTARSKAIQDATLYATEVPLITMKKSAEALPLIKEMVNNGNPNSITDGAVGALCIRTAVYGAFFNVKINAMSLKDKEKSNNLMNEAQEILNDVIKEEKVIMDIVMEKMK
ncbi:MAG TPA: glutamate formimidoyltransferase [Chitinophagaceae bacterium]|nr:glutamate formimidoyltransferase [Chitinophagaceae bacterium]